MSYNIGDNIIAPLGYTTDEVYQQVLEGCTSLKRYETFWGVPEPFVASLFSEEQRGSLLCDGLTFFESIAYRSASAAIAVAQSNDQDFTVKGDRTLFILSTTKANVASLEVDGKVAYPGEAAQRVAERLGVTTIPLVICNACISGLSALITAHRLLASHKVDYVIVCGADVQSLFIVSGFQSLKALSLQPCRPFDIERNGLNLGEAAATIVLSAHPVNAGTCCEIRDGVVRNDAYHISTPVKSGDGLTMALRKVLEDEETVDEIAFINAHGTATLFNDQMEAVALGRVDLRAVRVNALKGYIGHTMGAAGILETLLSMRSLGEGVVLGTKGYASEGVSPVLNISADRQRVDGKVFLKMLSGFGGCNAVLSCGISGIAKQKSIPDPLLKRTHHVLLTPHIAEVDSCPIEIKEADSELLVELYKKYVGDYPKFFKMDSLCRLGFVATELLLRKEGSPVCGESRSVILFNHSSSIDTDRKYLSELSARGGYFPSPSLFVYTLPNIVASEIAIRNHYKAETCVYILPRLNQQIMEAVIKATFCDVSVRSIITGWLDYESAEKYIADLCIIEKNDKK
ncbi:MAG: 3-oxoacyl-ACP synthase [Prevotellaceae bacterium]|nr:3-oxoacyl-ACP synthase [Prevotellaceae bacterium]